MGKLQRLTYQWCNFITQSVSPDVTFASVGTWPKRRPGRNSSHFMHTNKNDLWRGSQPLATAGLFMPHYPFMKVDCSENKSNHTWKCIHIYLSHTKWRTHLLHSQKVITFGTYCRETQHNKLMRNHDPAVSMVTDASASAYLLFYSLSLKCSL